MSVFDRVIEKNEKEFAINGTKFRFLFGGYTKETSEDEIIVFKPLNYFRKYLKLALDRGFSPKSMVELGIAEGGSAILFALLLDELKVVAIDIRKPNTHVLRHIERLGLGARIKLFYETAQDDESRLRSIMEKEFPGKVDIVLDDASHLLGPSRRSFEILLPYVGNDRFYILEDWGWAHWPGGPTDKLAKTPLSNLVFEMCMLTASRSDLIHETIVDSGKVIMYVKSTSSLDKNFRLEAAYINRGNDIAVK